MIMENNSYDKDLGNYTKENTDKWQNSIIWQMELEKVILDHQYVQLKNTEPYSPTTHSSKKLLLFKCNTKSEKKSSSDLVIAI